MKIVDRRKVGIVRNWTQVLAPALLAAGWIAGNTRAAITFDPDGVGANPPISVASFDLSVGNALADDIFSSSSLEGKAFDLLYQSRLGNLIDSMGNPVIPAGLNSAFEITIVAKSTYRVTIPTIHPNVNFTRGFWPDDVQPSSFLEIYFDSTPDADPLAGTGFNDGTRILLAQPARGPSGYGSYRTVFKPGGSSITEEFDRFEANNYPGIYNEMTVGGVSSDETVSTFNPSFFLSPVMLASFNTSLITPFEQTNPSHLFVGSPGGVLPTVVPSIGYQNGLPNSNAQDLQFQADANLSLFVPEPTGLAVIALAGAVVLLSRRGREA